MSTKRKKTLLVVIAGAILLIIVLALPPVWSRVSFHSRALYATVRYWIKPPSEAVFVPSSSGSDSAPTSIPITTGVSTSTPLPTATPTSKSVQSTPEATDTPSPTATPFPSSVLLSGIVCEQQGMNNCGPATLSMYLSFYKWGKNQMAAAAVLKPNAKDVNVMPEELVDFVNGHTDLHALWRYGGDLQTIRALLNAGYPVMIEKSFEPYDLRNQGWMGHYNLVVGYDDVRQSLTVHDSYLMIHTPWGSEIKPDMWDSFIGFDFSYSELEKAWRSFNYVFVVVYPPEDEDIVLKTLGPLATSEEACRIAQDRAKEEASSQTDVRNQFFAWFNSGTSLACLEDYESAAVSFDKAFSLYPDIEQNSRPYRILWYETGPYLAYYYTGRYQDVIDLADQTLGYMAEPVIEESYYWRAKSAYALGNTTRAIADLRASLKYHPGYTPSEELLKELGKTP